MIKIPQFKVSSFIHLNVFSIFDFIGNLAWLEESNELVSELPSFHLSVLLSFQQVFWIGSLVFPELYRVLETHMWIFMTWVFWEKFPFDKMTKNYQKWSLSNVFQFFRKVKSLFLSGNSVKWKYRCSFNISRKLHTLEKSYGQK